MSEIWHTERMYIETEDGTFVAQAFSLEDAAAIVREHNAHGVMLDALKAALEWVVLYWQLSPALTGSEPDLADQLRAAIALAEGGEE
jgi:hypothetical protein